MTLSQHFIPNSQAFHSSCTSSLRPLQQLRVRLCAIMGEKLLALGRTRARRELWPRVSTISVLLKLRGSLCVLLRKRFLTLGTFCR